MKCILSIRQGSGESTQHPKKEGRRANLTYNSEDANNIKENTKCQTLTLSL